MKLRRLLRCGFFIILFLLAGCSVLKRDVDNTPRPHMLETLSSAFDIHRLWATNVGKGLNDKFLNLDSVLVDNMLFTADATGQLFKINADNGRVIWQRKLETALSAGVVADDGFLYVATRDGSVIAVRQQDGETRWQADLGREVLALPVVSTGSVVALLGDNQVASLDSLTGRELWRYDGVVPPALMLQGASTPIIVDQQVLVGFATGRLLSLSLDFGNPQWDTAVAQPQGSSELERLVDIDATLLQDNDIVYAVTYQGQLAAIQLSDGALVWQRELSAYRDMALAGDVLYVVDAQSVIWAINKSNGSTLWKQNGLLHRALSAPTVYNNDLIVGDYDGFIHVLSLETGQIIARDKLSNDAIVRAPQADADRIYILTSGGQLSALTFDRS